MEFFSIYINEKKQYQKVILVKETEKDLEAV
jgi:hypothetical protein